MSNRIGVSSFKNAAMKGSVLAMQKLSALADHGDGILDLLPIISRHLDAKKIPDQVEPDNVPVAVQMAYQSIMALTRSLDHAAHSGPWLYPFLDEKWANIWAWTRFFLEDWFAQAPYTETGQTFQADVLMMSIRFLNTFYFDSKNDMQVLIGSTPKFVDVVARVWIAGLMERNHKISGYASTIFQSLLVEGDSSDDRSKEFFAFLDKLGQDVVGECIRTIIRDSQENNFGDSSLGSTIAITILIANISTKYNRLLLEKRYPLWMVYAMARMTSPSLSLKTYDPKDHPRLDAGSGNLTNCTIYLTRNFGESPAWIPKALEGRLIISIFRSWPYIVPRRFSEEGSLGNRYIDLLRVIQRYLNYPDVLHQAVKSMKTVESQGLDRGPEMEMRLPLMDAWQAFKNEVFYRKSLWVEYRLSRCFLCSYPQCPLVSKPETRLNSDAHQKRCSRCLAAFYCSPQCQNHDWKGGHRDACRKTTSGRRVGTPQPPTIADLAFINMAVRCDADNYTNRIGDLKAQWINKNRFFDGPLVAEMDYDSVPVGLTVTPLSHLKHIKEVRDRPDVVDELQTTVGNLVFARIPTSVTIPDNLSPAPPRPEVIEPIRLFFLQEFIY